MYIKICVDIKEAGGCAYIVGGYVRDYLMGTPSNDIDLEVFGLHRDRVKSILENYGEVSEVGKTKVLSLNNTIEVSVTPTASLYESAVAKRDLTINAIYYNPLTDTLIDRFDGMRHLREKKLVPVSDSFCTDPSRILRVARFISRYGFSPDALLSDYAITTAKDYNMIPEETLWEEWKKIMLGDNVVMALEWLFSTEWSMHYSELSSLKGLRQDVRHHPEGDVWSHTMYALEHAVINNVIDNAKYALVVRFATLLHDVGKVSTTEVYEDGSITSYGHASAGVDIARNFLETISAPQWLVEEVLPLVQEHMFTASIGDTISVRSVRRLSRRLEPANIYAWYAVVRADKAGRPPRFDRYITNKADKIYEIALDNDFLINPIQPLVMGRHLLELGVEAGREMGVILRILFEGQLDGEFDTVEEGLNWYRNTLDK